MIKSKNYCVMPHKGLALQNNGDYCVCNLNNMSFENKQKQPMSVIDTPLQDAWQSHTRKMIGAALDRNRELPACSQCWDNEKATGHSARTEFNRVFHTVPILSDQPRILILKPGNTCNLTCRMCNPATSSAWYADAYKLEKSQNKIHSSFAEYTRGFEHIRNSYNRDNTAFWNTFVEWLPNLVFVDIYGGEPFLMPVLFHSLKTVAAAGKSHNTDLQLHTNLTNINYDYLDILNHYKSVKIGLSVDSDMAEQLEYIRYPVSAESIFQNLKKLQQIKDQYHNIAFHINITVTPFNALNIENIKKNLREYFPVDLNLVTNPDEYDIRHIPLSVRKIIAEKNPSIAKFIMQTIPGCDQYWPKFWQITQELDRIRNQSFAHTFPEFHELIKPYVNNVFKS